MLQPLVGGGGSGGRIPPNYPTIAAEPPEPGKLPMNTPGGAIVPYGQGPVPLTATNLTGAGEQQKANPKFFENLMNTLNLGLMSNAGSKFARYAPGGFMAAQMFAGQDIAGGIGATAATIGAGKALKGVAAAIPNPLARGAVMLGGSVLAAGAGGLAGRATGGVINSLGQVGNQLIGGAQAAVGDVANTVAGVQREQGVSAGTGKEVGLGGITDKETMQRMALLNELGVNMPTRALENQYQIIQKYKNADFAHFMQAQQQNAQLAGALQRQLGTMQLAGMGMQETSETARTIMQTNPYQSAVLNPAAVRGIV